MEKEIKEIRVKLDGLTQLIKTLESSRERSLTITSLELSKMWLGKVLKELGTPNPYPESKNPNNERIEPTSDTIPVVESINNSIELSKIFEYTHIQKVKWLRAEIEKIENELKDNTYNLNEIFYKVWNSTDKRIPCYGIDHFQSSIKSCIEAGMWLGMELGRIRDLESK